MKWLGSLFTVVRCLHVQLAEMLNETILAASSLVEEFQEDDSRLTDAVCQDIADSLYDAACQLGENWLAEQDVYISALEQFS